MDVEKDMESFRCDLLLYTKNVYTNPPGNTSLEYPCIILTIEGFSPLYADNEHYKTIINYQVKWLDDSDGDFNTPYKIIKDIPYTVFSNEFTNDNIKNTILNTRRTI